jgi:hypothetical protein
MGAALRDALNQSAIQGAFSLDDSVHGYLKTTASLLDDASGASPKEVLNAFLAQPGSPAAFHIVP